MDLKLSKKSRINLSRLNGIFYSNIGQLIIAVILIILIYTIYTYPLMTNLNMVIGSSNYQHDSGSYYWTNWAFEQDLKENNPRLYSDWVLYPDGVNMLRNTSNWVMNLSAILFDEYAIGMNLYLILHFILASAGIVLLGRYLKFPFMWILLIVVFFNFYPARMGSYSASHYNLLSTGIVPWFVLSLLKGLRIYENGLGIRIKSIGYFLLCILLVFLSILVDYAPTAFLLYFCVFWYVYHRFSPAWYRLSRPRRAVFLLLVFLGLHLLTSVFISLGLSPSDAYWYQSDLSHYFSPEPGFHLIYHSWFPNLKWGGEHAFGVFMGYGVALLVVYLIFIYRKSPRVAAPWLFISLLFVLFTLPELSLWGFKPGLNSPTSFLHFIPVLKQNRVPFRLLQMMWLSLGIGLAYIAMQGSWILKRALPLVVMSLCFLEWMPNPAAMPKLDMRTQPAFIQAIARQPGRVMLTVPLGVRDGMRLEGEFDTNLMRYQYFYQKKLLSGYISRVPSELFESRLADPVWRSLMDWSKNPGATRPPPTAQQWLAFESRYKPDLICVYPQYASSPFMDSFILLIRSQGFEPVRTVEGYQIWAKASADPVSPVSAQ